ncbi:MAG: A24 family peptidase [Gammaproteobacteria bacterium]
MLVFDYLHANPAVFITVIGVLGLMVGSFLNVVIYRLPLMLEREWRSQCRELLDLDPAVEEAPFNLAVPRSRCPHCGHAITAMENIPILSYLALRGRCSSCGASISARYPIVEAATGLISVAVAWRFGFSVHTPAALVLSWALIALSMIDYDHKLLPDAITLPVLWLGLLLGVFGVFISAPQSVIGAVAGYLSLWVVFKLFKLMTGKEGMGYGDFKLLALLGAWMGWQMLPVIIILSSVVGAAVGIGLIALAGRDRSVPIPYGPYLAAAGWIALLWGHDIVSAYLQWAGLRGV